MPDSRLRLNAVVAACFCAGLLGSSASALAQEGFPGLSAGGLLSGPPAGWRLKSQLDVSTRWTDNARLSTQKGGGDYELRIVPAVSFSGNSGRLSGAARFSWENSYYARNKESSHNTLTGGATGTADLYERKLLVDGALSMSRQRTSVLGTPASTGVYDPNSQTMVRNYSISPYYLLRGSSGLSGELRYRYTYTDSDTSTLSNNRQHQALFSLGSETAAPLGWMFQASYSSLSYEQAQDSYTASARLTGTYAVDPLFHLIAIGGYEANNFVSTVGQNQVIYGGGFEWTPSPRTRVYASIEDRFFGTGYNAQISWRGPRSGISGRFVRDVTTSSNTLDANMLVNLYLSYVMSISRDVTDPLERLRLASETWKERGLPDTIGQGTTYVTQAYFLEQRGELAGSWNGVRNTLSASLYKRKHSRLADPSMLAPGDDLATFDHTDEIGGNIFATHTLSPRTSAMLGFNVSRSRGAGGFTGDSQARWRSATLSASTSLGVRTRGGLIYQYNASRGSSDFDENSLTANIGMTF